MHPTVLQEDKMSVAQSNREEETVKVNAPSQADHCASFLAHSSSDSMSTMILPVFISHESCPARQGNIGVCYVRLSI